MLPGAYQQNTGPRPPQSNRGRATPISLQTNALGSHNARYSYTDTPTELQRPTFQRSSSPANSVIEESPTHPHPPEESFSNPISHVQNTQFFVEKIPVSSSGTPYNLEPPPEEHPALSAPFAESTTPPEGTQFTEVRQSAGPLPNKIDEHPMSPVYSPTYPQSKTEPTKATSASDHTPIFYNPDSLAGPNVALDNHRPGQVSHPNAVIEPKWRHGLCEIDTLCCTGLCCPCVLYGKTQYRLSRRGQRQDPTDLLSYEPVNGSCGIMAAACGFQWILAAIQRTRIRKLYRLEGDFGDDCLKGLCCCCCVLMQDEREVRDREELIRRHAGLVSGYASSPTMSYAPPPR